MKVLVTGAAGFMGSHLVDALVALNSHEVYGVDDLSGGYTRNVNPKSQFTKLDLREREKVKEYIHKVKPEILFHLAADATEGRSQFTPISATERNLLAYLYTLVPSIGNGLKRVVLTSSMSVYGAQKPPFSENMRRIPEDVYGISKSAMEGVTEVLAKVHKFEYVIIRPHNVYGPKQNLSDPYRNVIGIFINCLLNNKNFYIYGDGEQKRAFTYIDDFTPYMLKAGFSKEVNGKIINIGPSQEYTINEMAKVVVKNFFPDGKMPAHMNTKYLPDRPQEVKEAYCTNDVAQKLLGYKTTVDLEEGIGRMIAWAKSLGPQPFHYLQDGMEIQTEDVPLTWKNKLI
ncbi:MAG: NAD-dependent epimerase/dehydratase family protein [Candidatus Levybacteria bacterium]|nr:NAD-dependent epimerase/dehydratase family protein [Candidatus Levybacteria bacterium]